MNMGTERKFDLEVDRSNISQLKSMIEEDVGVQPLTQNLIFKGKYLDNHSTIEDENISDGDTIHFVI